MLPLYGYKSPWFALPIKQFWYFIWVWCEMVLHCICMYELNRYMVSSIGVETEMRNFKLHDQFVRIRWSNNRSRIFVYDEITQQGFEGRGLVNLYDTTNGICEPANDTVSSPTDSPTKDSMYQLIHHHECQPQYQ